MSALLDVYAGDKAYSRIKADGFHPQQFDFMLGASGGPKWFVLAGLDRYIFPEFFANRSAPLNIVGSSAGAFRFACFAQRDPLAAINRLAERYSHTVYSEKPGPREITEKGVALLDHVLGDKGAAEIIANKHIHAHFIVARCIGMSRFESKPLQVTGLLASAGANLIRRGWLQRFYQRYVFSNPESRLKICDPSGMPSFDVRLREDNLKQALMSSGSIPIVIEGVRDIPGAPPGVYRDGGIIDYHFDLSFQAEQQTGLTLYPHFSARPIPGWFDKSLKNRRPHPDSYKNVVMIVPSDDFVARLPFGKIPDRKDFETMQADERISYWQTVLSESDRLGEALSKLVASQSIVDRLKPLRF